MGIIVVYNDKGGFKMDIIAIARITDIGNKTIGFRLLDIDSEKKWMYL